MARTRTPRKVIVQPADPLKDRKNLLRTQKKIRVAYYARVSTDSEEQKTSFDTQKEYYEELITQHSNWTLVRGYADQGISGTNTTKRDEFNQMISDCKAGKIDLILTKSISRFARNTVDTLTTVRDLQRIGVSVIFEKENINTANQDCEMLITIFGSIAQEESRSTSESIKWAIKAKFERGEIMMCTSRFMGYDRNENGDLIINEEEAKVVRLIAMLYLSGMSWEEIARNLDKRGIKTITGKERWNASTIGSILKNEKYAGFAIQGKTYTLDFLTKKRAKNKGERPKYKTMDGIPAILPLNIFMRIQEEIARRAIARKPNVNGEYVNRSRHGQYALSELLQCANCGNRFRRVTWTLGGKKVVVYRCKGTVTKGMSCKHSPTLKESDLERAVILSINKMKQSDTEDKVYSIVLNNIKEVIECEKAIDISEIDRKVKEVKERMVVLIEQGMNGFEEDSQVDEKLIEQANLLKQLQDKKGEIEETEKNHTRIDEIKNYVDTNTMNIKQFDNAFMRKMIDKIDVFDDASIDIHFKFGAVVHRQLQPASVK